MPHGLVSMVMGPKGILSPMAHVGRHEGAPSPPPPEPLTAHLPPEGPLLLKGMGCWGVLHTGVGKVDWHGCSVAGVVGHCPATHPCRGTDRPLLWEQGTYAFIPPCLPPIHVHTRGQCSAPLPCFSQPPECHAHGSGMEVPAGWRMGAQVPWCPPLPAPFTASASESPAPSASELPSDSPSSSASPAPSGVALVPPCQPCPTPLLVAPQWLHLVLSLCGHPQSGPGCWADLGCVGGIPLSMREPGVCEDPSGLIVVPLGVVGQAEAVWDGVWCRSGSEAIWRVPLPGSGSGCRGPC